MTYVRESAKLIFSKGCSSLDDRTEPVKLGFSLMFLKTSVHHELGPHLVWSKPNYSKDCSSRDECTVPIQPWFGSKFQKSLVHRELEPYLVLSQLNFYDECSRTSRKSLVYRERESHLVRSGLNFLMKDCELAKPNFLKICSSPI